MNEMIMFVLFLIFTIGAWITYHKIFTVYYFDFSQGLLKELIISVVIGLLLTGLSLKFWYASVIIILLVGIGFSSKTGSPSMKKMIMGIAAVVAVIVSVVGIRFNVSTKEAKEAEADEEEYDYDAYDNSVYDNDMNNNAAYDNGVYDNDTYDYVQEEYWETTRAAEDNDYAMYNFDDTNYNVQNSDDTKDFAYGIYYGETDNENFNLSANVYCTSEAHDDDFIHMSAETGDSIVADYDGLLMPVYDSVYETSSKSDNTCFQIVFFTDGFTAAVLNTDEESAYALEGAYYFAGDINFDDNNNGQYISEYILPDSNSKYLTLEDLSGFSSDKCKIARNEIYARHGRIFSDENLQQYFESLSWYQGLYSADEFDESWLNEYETANRDLIIQYEKEQGYR